MNPSAIGLRVWHGLGLVGMVVLMFSLPACGDKPAGTVKGTVKFKGELLKSGVINLFAPERGAGVEMTIDESGAFESKAPIGVGKYKVFVNPPRAEQLPPGTKPSAPKAAFPQILPKYQDPSQTPLTADIKAGPNVVPIEIPN